MTTFVSIMIMENKLVSAIITTHNRKKLLNRAINSVFAQTYSPIELIVVDDNSTDGTRDGCSQYPIKYIYIPKEESRGGNYARNLGVKAASGDYCAFLDDDDYWLPEKIEKQVRLIEEKKCELVYCGRRMEYVEPSGIKFVDSLPTPYFSGDVHKKILMGICTTTTCMMAQRQSLCDVGLFDESLSFWQEYDLTIRLAQRKPFYYVNEPLSVYRVDVKDKGRLTNKFDEWKKAVKYIYAKHSDLYAQLNLLEREYVKINYVSDAILRSKNSGRQFLSYYYKTLLWTRFLPARILRKILGTN